MNDITIAASILNADFGKMAETITKLEKANTDWIHFDIMDGSFVPPISFGAPVVKSLKPYCGELLRDVHLMVDKPELQVEQFAKAGAQMITFHVEATKHPHRLVQIIKSLGPRAGIALNPATPVAMVQDLLRDVDLVLVMTVNPGWGGQEMIPNQLEKVKELRSLLGSKRSPKIQVDGGVTPLTAGACIEAGADILVAGSAIIGTNNYVKAVKSLKDISVQRRVI
ncbi:MAG: ribulose-phosphate 3-epimerase [Gammaproteobacteria bacterium]|nr:ribulose-phosphate 3-epimerase [Gammaproteobacteria bacterium]